MSDGLALRGVVRRFPGAPAPTLRGVHLEVGKGSCVALLGPSGCGKSTVLRLVAGLDIADAGDVRISGRSLHGVAPERRRTALVFQRPRLFPHLDVLDNVAFPLAAAGLRRHRARTDAGRFLELVGLTPLAGRRPSSLSGGQEQRVALARALAARPDVLLLDEPFSALDPALRAEMHALLRDLRAAVEPTLLLVTHDRHEAAVVADTVAVLLDGRIVQHATASQLHTAPASLDVHSFLDGRNAVSGRVADGRHLSALGALALPGAPDDGTGHLVIRQEALQLTGPHDATADVIGTVRSVDRLGPRNVVTVDCSGVQLTAEVASTQGDLSPGAVVGLVLPILQRHVLPDVDVGSGGRARTKTAASVSLQRHPSSAQATVGVISTPALDAAEEANQPWSTP
jgi:putative spermidine/putrescine transport system ATP-binding protein